MKHEVGEVAFISQQLAVADLKSARLAKKGDQGTGSQVAERCSRRFVEGQASGELQRARLSLCT